MTEKPVEIPTPDGVADGFLLYPSEEGSHPGVIFYMDGIGLRPTLVELAGKIARRGYCVLLPNLFYRRGRAPLFDPARFLAGENREETMATMKGLIAQLTPPCVERDSAAFLDFLQGQKQVLPGKMATTGYCMGGSISLRTAGAHPERIAGAASFHGGNLATQNPDSPHLLADRITAQLYIGHAQDDPSCPREQIERLDAALQNAGVRHQSEVYEARHGWVMPDIPVYNEAAAEKAWQRLFDLLDQVLPPTPGAASDAGA